VWTADGPRTSWPVHPLLPRKNPGKTGVFEWSGEDEIRTCGELFVAIKAFFKDNPGWE